MLKRLDDALNGGLDVRAIIRNSGVNQDGKTPGITVPSLNAQQSLIASAYVSAGINPTQVGYVEAYDTGTEVGDAAEMEIIAKVFCGGRSRPSALYVGSVKSNIGYLENVSGRAGLIKSVLMLENAVMPLNSGLNETRKYSEWEILGIKVGDELLLQIYSSHAYLVMIFVRFPVRPCLGRIPSLTMLATLPSTASVTEVLILIVSWRL